MGQQYVPFVIPCKPTSPKVKVELIHEGGEVNVTSFNETIGFTVVTESTEVKRIEIECLFTLVDNSESHYIQIDLNRRFHFQSWKFQKAFNQVFSQSKHNNSCKKLPKLNIINQDWISVENIPCKLREM